MKALTLTQPWASLVALGEKRIETRGSADSRFLRDLADEIDRSGTHTLLDEIARAVL
jgi:hypothetical protein